MTILKKILLLLVFVFGLLIVLAAFSSAAEENSYRVFFLGLLFIVVSVSTYYFSIIEGIPEKYVLKIIVFSIGGLYFMALFARVAIKGQAPAGWIPWE